MAGMDNLQAQALSQMVQQQPQKPQGGGEGEEAVTGALETLNAFAVSQSQQGNDTIKEALLNLMQAIQGGGQPPQTAPQGPMGPGAQPTGAI